MKPVVACWRRAWRRLNEAPGFKHDSRANFLVMDGHVEPKTYNQAQAELIDEFHD